MEEKIIISVSALPTQPEEDKPSPNSDLLASNESLSETKEKGALFGVILKKTPKATVDDTEDPLQGTNELGESDDESLPVKDTQTLLSASNDSLNEVSTTKERMRAFVGMFKKAPKAVEQQDDDEPKPLGGGRGLKRRKTITRKKRVVSFRVKRTLPRTATVFFSAQEDSVEIQNVEMAAYPTEGNNRDAEESDELMEWWNGVVGWAEWNETSNFQEEDEERYNKSVALMKCWLQEAWTTGVSSFGDRSIPNPQDSSGRGNSFHGSSFHREECLSSFVYVEVIAGAIVEKNGEPLKHCHNVIRDVCCPGGQIN
ncbi:unnamed protein product [Boreogadus saida]